MTPTIQTFTRALLTPDLSFTRLADARVVTGADGLPQLMRTTRFAEAEIEWHGHRWLLSLPLSSAAVASVERTAAQIGRLNTDWLTPYRILPDELRWTDPAGVERRCDLMLEYLPAGVTFEQALRGESAGRLLEGLNRLQEELRRLEFAHNNLRPQNLRWAGGRFIPIRYHDARFGHPENDERAFDRLREEVLRRADPMQVSDVETPYDPLRRITGHRWTSQLFEGLVCVEDEGGYGYVDAENRVVIPATFRWAGDFHEGRAEVETETGMGLIDRQGRWILPPRYEIVDYDPVESIVRVRQEGRWAEFDYLGRQQTRFEERPPQP